MKMISTLGFVSAAMFALIGTASAADMPMKAAPAPVVSPYDWSGLYVGFHDGYSWASVHDTTAAGFVGDSTVNNGIIGFHVGLQKEFAGFGFGNFVLGAEGGLNEPLNRNDLNNFSPCANPAFACGITNFHDNWYAGGRLGLAWNWAGGGWLFGGDYLFTVSGGWTTAIFQRADVLLATGAVNAGGGQSLARHNGGYVGVGLEHVWAKGNLVDYITGIDWQHQFFDAQGDLDANAVIHNLSADVDIIRLRTTLKFK